MKKLTGIQIGILVAVIITAVLHLAAAMDKILFPDGPDPLFILNGLGYLGLLGAYFLPIPFFQQRHKLVRWALIGFAIVTIIAWLVIWVGQYVIIAGEPFFSHDSIYGVPAKIDELVLLALLWKDKPRQGMALGRA
jgi:CDP-diglyceride synthetase